MRSTRLVRLLTLLPGILILFLIFRYGVNVPLLDQWDLAETFLKYHDGTLSFQALISQANESRPFFPRLFFLALAEWTRWHQKMEMLCGWSLVASTTLMIWRIQARTGRSDTLRAACQLLLASLLLFSPVGRQNWLWGIQLIVFIPLACLCLNLVVLTGGRCGPGRLLLVGLSCTVSTFSYANGILVWVISIPVYLWHERAAVGKQPAGALFLLLCLGLNGWVYFHDYVSPAYHPRFAAALSSPVAALEYFCAFTGLLFSGGLKSSAVTAGVAALLCYLLAGGALVLNRRDRAFIDKAVPWLAIGMLGLFSAAVTTLGRVGFGVDQALSSRYAAFGAPVYIGLIYLAPMILARVPALSSPEGDSRLRARILPALFAMLVLVHLSSAQRYLPGFRQDWIDQLKSKALIAFSSVFPDIDAFRYVYPKPYPERARALNAIGYLHPKMATSRDIGPWAAPGGPDPQRGALLVAQPVKARRMLCIGWTRLPRGPRAADTVLLTFRHEGAAAEQIAALVELTDLPPAILPRQFQPSPQTQVWGFQALIPSAPRDGGTQVRAWAFDAATEKAYLLPSVMENVE